MGGAAATILYVFVGGFLAVSWTDTVQASPMIFCPATHASDGDHACQPFADALHDVIHWGLHRHVYGGGIISLMAWANRLYGGRIFGSWRLIRCVAVLMRAGSV